MPPRMRSGTKGAAVPNPAVTSRVPSRSAIPMNPTNSLRTFEGAVAIVTGGASGIGRALGESLARRGARVVLADVQVDLAEEVAVRIRAGGGQATAENLDVTDFTATNRVLQSSFQNAGRL